MRVVAGSGRTGAVYCHGYIECDCYWSGVGLGSHDTLVGSAITREERIRHGKNK